MIANIFTALRAGYELSNSAAWKRGGVAVASLTALLSALTGIAVARGWLPSDVPPDTIMQISSGIVAIVGVFLSYVQTATTTKIGLGPPVEATADGPLTRDELVARTIDGVVNRLRDLPGLEKCPSQATDSTTESAQNGRTDVRPRLMSVEDAVPDNYVDALLAGVDDDDDWWRAMRANQESADEAVRQTQPLDPVELSHRIRRGEFTGQHRVVRPEPVPTDRQGFWDNPQRGPFLD